MDIVQWIRALPGHVAEAVRTLTALRSIEGIRQIILIGFLVFSGLATALGLRDLLMSGREAPGVLEVAIAMGLAVGIVMFMWWALEVAIRSLTIRRFLALFAVYVILMLWSISFGFGFYWKMLSAADVAEDNMRRGVAAAQMSADTAIEQIKYIPTVLTRMENASNARRQREANEGDSCGVDTPRGEGPYFRTRQDIDEAVAGLTGDLRSALNLSEIPTLKVEIDNLSKAANDAPGNESQREQLNRYRDFGAGANRILSALNAKIELAQGRKEGFEKLASSLRAGHDSGRGVRCFDEALASSLERTANDLEGLKKATLLSEATVNPELDTAATRAAFFRVWGTVLRPIGFKSEGALTFQQSDVIALFAALGVDLVIFAATVAGRRREPLLGLEAVLTRGLQDRRLRRALARLIGSGGHDVRTMFDRSTALYRHQAYLVASEDVPEYHAAIANIQAALADAGAGRFLGAGPSRGLLRRGAPPAEDQGWLPVVQRRLVRTAEELARAAGRASDIRKPSAFAATRMSVMILRPSIVTALRLTFDELDAAPEAITAEVPDPRRPPEPPSRRRRRPARRSSTPHSPPAATDPPAAVAEEPLPEPRLRHGSSGAEADAEPAFRGAAAETQQAPHADPAPTERRPEAGETRQAPRSPDDGDAA